jgi:hypothetical protein
MQLYFIFATRIQNRVFFLLFTSSYLNKMSSTIETKPIIVENGN